LATLGLLKFHINVFSALGFELRASHMLRQVLYHLNHSASSHTNFRIYFCISIKNVIMF
jgi:hypothetical protein